MRKWLVIRCRGILLRNGENVQGKSAAKSNVEHINVGQAFEQSGRNANVRKQEEEIVVGIVLIILRGGEVRAGPHGTTAACLRQKKGCVQNRVAGTRKHKNNM